MTNATKTILAFAITAIAAGGGFIAGRYSVHLTEAGAIATEPADAPPAVPVKTAIIYSGRLSQMATAYGTVQSEPGASAAMSVPFESQIGQVLVTPGQRVEVGAALIKLTSSPDALLQLRTAKNELSAASRQIDQVKERVKEQLATQSDLLTAEQTLEAAKTQLDSLTQRGVGESQVLKANVAGVVAALAAQPGQIIAPGTAIVTIDPEDRIEARIGVNPQDVAAIHIAQTIELRDVHDATDKRVTGTVRLVSRQVNPDTRFVDVFVTLPMPSPLALQSFVSASIATRSAEGLIVPRSAVLPDDDKWVLFTLDGNKAVRREVNIDLETDTAMEVSADGLKQGDAVVVSGNAELEDQMAVEIEPAAPASLQPPTSQSATSQPAVTGPAEAP